MMKFDLKRPCGNCPFRNDRPDQEGWLGEERAQEIVDSLVQGTFVCHKTSDALVDTKKEEQHCAGALIMLEKEDIPSQAMRIAERMGIYNPGALDVTAPVFGDVDEFVGSHA